MEKIERRYGKNIFYYIFSIYFKIEYISKFIRDFNLINLYKMNGKNNIKRLLTGDEINNILDFIVPQEGIPRDSAISICEKNKARLILQLKDVEIYPENIPFLKEMVEKAYFSSLIQPGENVGIQAAQNVGKEQTQTTLDAFHKAGATESLLVGGISRFNEILSMTKEPRLKCSKIYFKKRYLSIYDLQEDISNELLYITFGKVTNKFYPCFNREQLLENDRKLWIDIYENVFGKIKEKKFLVYYLNSEILFNNKISLTDISNIILDNIENVKVVISPPNIFQLIIIPKENDDKDIYNLSIQLYKLYISGIYGISSIYPFKNDNEWIVETDGTNYREILNHIKVDYTRTISTHIWDIYNIFGIESVREYLISEMAKIMPDVNECNLEIIADVMTYSGIPTSISRFAIKKKQVGPIAKSTFEEPLTNFLQVAFHGESDNTEGVSAGIIFGKLTNIGTGVCDVLYDNTSDDI